MDKETQMSLHQIVEYLYADEEKHWEENNRPFRHIFHDILRVSSWLDATAPKSD